MALSSLHGLLGILLQPWMTQGQENAKRHLLPGERPGEWEIRWCAIRIMVGIGQCSEQCGHQPFQPLRTVGTFVRTRASTGMHDTRIEVERQPRGLVVPSSAPSPQHHTAYSRVAVPRASGESPVSGLHLTKGERTHHHAGLPECFRDLNLSLHSHVFLAH